MQYPLLRQSLRLPYRNLQKTLLTALLTPSVELKALQDKSSYTELLVRQEEMKTMPFGEIWNEYCRRCGVPEDGAWFAEVRRCEKEVLEARA